MLTAAVAAIVLAAGPSVAAPPAVAPPPAAPSPPPSPPPSSSPATVESELPPARQEAIRRAVETAMTRHGIPGLSAALVSGGKIVFSAGFGMADLERFAAATPHTVYRLASVSKPITATAVLQLHEKGRLDLDLPIERYVPAWPPKPWPVTARQLLAHQAGVRNWRADEFHATARRASIAESLATFKDDPLAFAPGTSTLYTSLGYNLLGAAIESVAGQSYAEYLRTRVFGPAGMVWARVDEVLPIVPNRASGYRRGPGGELVNAELSDVTNRVPGGGLAATAEDVARFAQALLSGVLLEPQTLRLAFTPQRTRNGKATGYGLGWVIDRKGTEVYHLGGQPKVSTILWLAPRRGTAVVLLCNLEGVSPQLLDLARQVARIVG